jgi:hypothetical protein
MNQDYYLAMDTLNRIISVDSVLSIHNPLYVTSKYFAENRNKEVLLSLGSEKKEIVLEAVDFVLNSQIALEMAKKDMI